MEEWRTAEAGAIVGAVALPTPSGTQEVSVATLGGEGPVRDNLA